MVLSRESKYPNRRAYVLKLRADARPDAFAGRVENLVTGQRLEFGNSLELVGFINRDLEAAADPGPEEGADA